MVKQQTLKLSVLLRAVTKCRARTRDDLAWHEKFFGVIRLTQVILDLLLQIGTSLVISLMQRTVSIVGLVVISHFRSQRGTHHPEELRTGAGTHHKEIP